MSRDKEEKKTRYYEADQEKIQQKLAEIGSGEFFKPKEGKNIVRILPPWSKKGLWYKEATIHYGLAKEGKERGYTCLKMFDKDCPVCEKREDLLQGDAEEKELADKLRPRTKYYANVLDRKTGKVSVWGFTPKTLGILLSYATDPDFGDISHPEDGFDVVIERTGTTRTDTKYQIRCRPKPSEIGDEVDWEAGMKNLDDIVKEPDEEELQDIMDEMFGKSGKKHRDEDEDEDRPRKKKDEEDEDEDKPRKKRDEEDEDEDKDRKKKKDEEEEDEDKSDRKRSRDEDEDESRDKKRKKDEEEDEDDAAERRRKRRRERRDRD